MGILRRRLLGWPLCPGETSKAKNRRVKEGFFDLYCQGRGLDIGFGGDLLSPNCQGWDIGSGDAQSLKGLPDTHFDFVYSSHCLEHVGDPRLALLNWWRVLKPGGHLILYVPHRDLYERRLSLPSVWNPDHKRFFLLDRDEPPDTVGLIPLIRRSLSHPEVICTKVCDAGYRLNSDGYPEGECSIEVVIQKGRPQPSA